MKAQDLNGISKRIAFNQPLSSLTTFQLGGPCRGVITCRTSQELREAVEHFNAMNAPFILIGGGSNLLVSDQGVDCYVVRYFSKEPLIERKGDELIVTGSTVLDDLALFAAREGLSGVNCTTGIPGTVGGAVMGNAGAFGKQIGDCLKEARLMDLKGRQRTATKEDLGFSYRHSNLKETNDIVVDVSLALTSANKDLLLKEREEILALRRSKHPDLTRHPCAGSFFRNIEPSSKAGRRQATGWFLDQAGGKTLSHGGASIFEKHANIIIKSKGCTAQDVYELSKKMESLAKEKFGLDLVREVRLVGPFEHADEERTGLMW